MNNASSPHETPDPNRPQLITDHQSFEQVRSNLEERLMAVTEMLLDVGTAKTGGNDRAGVCWAARILVEDSVILMNAAFSRFQTPQKRKGGES